MSGALLALAAAVCFAVSTVLQHRAAGGDTVARTSPLRLLLSLLRRPVWLIGTAAGGAGLVLHGAALAHGSLVVIQPLLVSGLLFALPLSVLLERRRPDRREWGYALVVVVGLAVFLSSAQPGNGVSVAGGAHLLAAVAAASVASGAAVALGLTAGRLHRPALYGLAAGLGYGATAALLKQVVDIYSVKGASMPVLAPLAGVVIVGGGALVLTQVAYRAGRLASSLPAMTIGDPLTASLIGAAAFGEHLAAGSASRLGQLLGAVLMSWGVVRLATLTALAKPGTATAAVAPSGAVSWSSAASVPKPVQPASPTRSRSACDPR